MIFLEKGIFLLYKNKKKECLNVGRHFFTKVQVSILKAMAFLLQPGNKKNPDKKDICRILIYGGMGIGNLIMFTPTIKAIRNKFPNSYICLLTLTNGSEQVLKKNDLVDKILVTSPIPSLTYISTINIIRKKKFDLLISSFHGSIFKYHTIFAGIPWRIGHVSGPDWESPYDFLYNIKVPMDEHSHEVDRGIALAKALNADVTDRLPFYPLNTEDKLFASNFFNQNCANPEKDWLLGVQIGTWRPQSWKQWDLKKTAAVCNRLCADLNLKTIVLGAPSDIDILHHFMAFLDDEPIIALGKCTVGQSSAIVEQCHAVLCNDSGLMHIAAGVGTPVIAIFGPTDIRRTAPIEKNHLIIRKNFPCSPCFTMREMASQEKVRNCPHRKCLESITPEDVIVAIKNHFDL